MALEFIEKTHTYLLDGEEVPSVSEIIRFAEREVYKEPNKFQMDQAADRGTRVHKACEELDRTGSCECDGDIAGYVNAYAKFLADNKVEWDMIEQPVIGLGGRYAGTLDRLGKLNDKKVILDIKTTRTITGKHKVLYGAQMSMYAAARTPDNKGLPDDADLYILQLKDDGTYKLIKLKFDPGLVSCCLYLHESFEKTKRRKKKHG